MLELLIQELDKELAEVLFLCHSLPDSPQVMQVKTRAELITHKFNLFRKIYFDGSVPDYKQLLLESIQKHLK